MTIILFMKPPLLGLPKMVEVRIQFVPNAYKSFETKG